MIMSKLGIGEANITIKDLILKWSSKQMIRLGKFIVLIVATVLLAFPVPSWAAKNPAHLFFSHSLLQGRDFSNQSLPAAEFANSNMELAKFDHSDLEGAIFSKGILTKASLKQANLTYAMLDQADFTEADLSDAVLVEALFLGSTFRNVKIIGADFSDAILDREQIRQLCEIASGVNSTTGVETRFSLGCR